MKKTVILLFSAAMILGTTAGTALAKPGNTPPGHSSHDVKANESKETKESKDKNKDKDKQIEANQDGGIQSSDPVKQEEKPDQEPASTETENGDSSTADKSEPKEKGHKGYKGLLNAIQNVKDKPAGAVLANILLSEYEAELTDEQKKELEAIVEKDEALEKAADMLDKNGNVTDAVYVQEEAIKVNFKNLDLYKTLGKLNDKAGKKNGVKLYVNGVAADTEPFVKKGNTFVPFRAIAEALDAEVAWDPQDRTITVTKDGVIIQLLVGSKAAKVNGKNVTLDAPATVTKGSTYVPVRFISEALNATVKWESESKTVVVYEEGQ